MLSILLLATITTSACGYRIAGRKLDGGKGLTIAVPTFVNRTTSYRIEQRLTEAVRQELIRRTRFSVNSVATGDVVVDGEVTGILASPIILNQAGRASSYSMIVDMKVTVTDTRKREVIFKDDHWTFREVFELAQSSAGFSPEDSAAMDRLARRFAASLVSTMLHAKP